MVKKVISIAVALLVGVGLGWHFKPPARLDVRAETDGPEPETVRSEPPNASQQPKDVLLRSINAKPPKPATPSDEAVERGEQLVLENQHAEAIQRFDDAIRLDPKNGLAYAGRAGSKEALGSMSEAERDYNRAAICYQFAYKAGDPVAMRHLGDCFYAGKGVGVSKVKSMILYRLAAHSGDIEAHVNWGFCLFYGHGVQQDFVEAAELFRMASDAGSPRGMYYTLRGQE